ncbi:hypothetical protein F4777DRAFT_593836 [Nemania sp. FL0916]|nr:hypothetical protein F4777DRAFT_593836 [Nemania sp. FL0916]
MVNATVTCCSALAAVLPSKISFPGSPVYNASLTSYYSAQEASVHPACIVSPTSSTHVSKAIKTLVRMDCDFAIRSGGHSTWAGDSNIASGVTLDLQGLNIIDVNTKTSTVSVGPGARWGEVYAALAEHDLIVAGGRVGTVGVGGLTLGGGISSFGPRFGWTCDSVRSLEVVLADGSIVNASEKTHEYADLLHALRGGSNNFGVVTRIDFRAHAQGDIWGGVVTHAFDTVPQQLAATAGLASADPYDEFANLVQGFSYEAGGGRSVVNTLHYTKPVAYPAFFKAFTDIPSIGNNTLRTANYSDFAIEGAVNNPNGFRTLLATTSIGSSLPVLTAAFDAWNNSIAAFDNSVGVISQLLVEPIPQIAYRAAPAGTNVLGLDDAEGGLVVLGLAVGWLDPADDALVTQVAQKIIAEIDTQAKNLGESFEFKYLNYAAQWQDVIAGYGADNVAKLKKVSRRYDPHAVFQRNVPGGYKIF